MFSEKQVLLENEYGKLEGELFLGQLFLHLTLYKWSVNLYKVYREFFDNYLPVLRRMGFTKVYVAIPKDNKKLIKFERMFGFEPEHDLAEVLIMSRST